MTYENNDSILLDNITKLCLNVSKLNASPSVCQELIASIFNNTVDDASFLYPLPLVIPITVIYAIIFVTGVIGNISTCVVISKNKSMHTATNYYLFSLAISDMLLLLSALPPEMYRIWSPDVYVFGETFCVLQGFAAETAANATVLTITAFTVERYLAICHPFLSHTMSKLSRAIKYIIAIWFVALCLAVPQAIQFGVEVETNNGVQISHCTVVWNIFQHAFEISTFLFFVGPMTLITVLYVLIALQLRKSRKMSMTKRPASQSSQTGSDNSQERRITAAQNRVVKMLVAVVAAFFICWAPFHAQRLLAVYLSHASEEDQETSQTTITIYMILMYLSGVLYFLSTTINPVLYNIMSNKFREAFKKTFSGVFYPKKNKFGSSRTYSVLAKYPPLMARSVSEGVQAAVENLDLRNNYNPERDSFLGITSDKDVTKHSSYKNGICSKNKPKNFLRENSESSQATVMSSLSTGADRDSNTAFFSHIEPPKCVKEEVKQNNGVSYSKINDNTDEAITDFKQRVLKLFQKKNELNNVKRKSIDNTNTNTNTISNSSLQDIDEMEYSSSDLVKYMKEVNVDVIA